MLLHQDFAATVAVDTTRLPWVDSPEPGVRRRLIERDGGEVARATSIVAYAPGSKFARHVHGLGEEFVVLGGEFRDEHGAYSAGSYVRNPPGSSHAPFTEHGCTLFVKLRGLHPQERRRVVRSLRGDGWQTGGAAGLTVMPLAGHGRERAAFVRWKAGTRVVAQSRPGGEEIYVIDGVFSDERGDHAAGTWLRSPRSIAGPAFSDKGCTVFVKTGHLPPVSDGGARRSVRSRR